MLKHSIRLFSLSLSLSMFNSYQKEIFCGSKIRVSFKLLTLSKIYARIIITSLLRNNELQEELS